MTNVTLMNVENGYLVSYDTNGSRTTYIFHSLQESFDFIARLYNDVDYYNQQLEATRLPQNNEPITSDSLTV